MPEITLTDDEKVKFKAYLKEMGFENEDPPALIKRLNEDAKTNREAREAAEKLIKDLEKNVKTLTDEKTKRDDDEKKRLADEEAKKKAEEDSRKTAAELVKDAEARFELKLKEATLTHQNDLKERDKAIKARDQRLLTSAVRSVAKEKGLIDLDLVSLLDLKGVKIEDGEPDMESISAIVAKHAEEKPHLYDATKSVAAEQAQTGTSYFDRLTRPQPASTTGQPSKVDYKTLNDADFDRAEQALRAQRF